MHDFISDKTVLKFVAAHKPQRIDVQYMIDEWGSVANYLDAEAQPTGNLGEYYIEINKWNSVTGNPIIIDWRE